MIAHCLYFSERNFVPYFFCFSYPGRGGGGHKQLVVVTVG